jgi:general secretion pathway protein F
MGMFYYKAVDREGNVLEGERESRSKADVIAWLQGADNIPIRVEERRNSPPRVAKTRAAVVHKKTGWLSGLVRPSQGSSKLPPSLVEALTRELYTLLHAGLPLDRALQMLIDLNEVGELGLVTQQLQTSIREGASLSEALEASSSFGRFYVSMIRAGEEAGVLEAVLERLVNFMERSRKLRESVKSALIYPAILLVVAGLSVVLLLTFVVPQFSQLFEDAGQALPLATRVVIAMGNGLTQYWWVMVALIGGGILFIQDQLANEQSRLRWDRWFLVWPLVGDLVTKIETARLSRTLGTLLDNGVPILKALSIAQGTLGNQLLVKTLQEVSAGMQEGKNLADPLLKSGHFPALAVQLIRVGEETGSLEKMLLQIADIYDDEVQSTVQRLLALLEPALILSLGVIIAAIILSILMAILSINQLAF